MHIVDGAGFKVVTKRSVHQSNTICSMYMHISHLLWDGFVSKIGKPFCFQDIQKILDLVLGTTLFTRYVVYTVEAAILFPDRYQRRFDRVKTSFIKTITYKYMKVHFIPGDLVLSSFFIDYQFGRCIHDFGHDWSGLHFERMLINNSLK